MSRVQYTRAKTRPHVLQTCRRRAHLPQRRFTVQPLFHILFALLHCCWSVLGVMIPLRTNFHYRGVLPHDGPSPAVPGAGRHRRDWRRGESLVIPTSTASAIVPGPGLAAAVRRRSVGNLCRNPPRLIPSDCEERALSRVNADRLHILTVYLEACLARPWSGRCASFARHLSGEANAFFLLDGMG
ncbi:hypothetical protein BV20DRAFT_469375 [Pilatotrama ljubarskyi]|nr:hypothetical protein BV20DRAFT_469375 [Pilatotrama ljubarskyi]